MKKQKGFSLIELVVSVAILSIAVIALMQTFTLAARMNRKAGKDEKVQYLASNVMERIKAENLNSWREKAKNAGSDGVPRKIGQEEYTVTYEGPDSGTAGSNYTLTFTTDPNKSSETIYNGKYVAEAIVKTKDYSKAATPEDKGEQTVSSINNYRVPVVHNVTASHNFLLGNDELAADPAAVSLLAAKLENHGGSSSAIDFSKGTGFHQYLQVRVFTKELAGSDDSESEAPAAGKNNAEDTKTNPDTSGNSSAQVTVQWRFLYSAAELGDDKLNDINLSSSDADTFLIWPAEDPSSTADWFSRTLVAPYTGDIYRGLPLIDSVLTLQEPEKNTAEAGSGYGPGMEGIHIDDSTAANPIMLQISGFSSIYTDAAAREKAADRLFVLDSGSNYSPNLQTGSTGRDRLFTVEVYVYEADSEGKKTGSPLYSLRSTKSE